MGQLHRIGSIELFLLNDGAAVGKATNFWPEVPLPDVLSCVAVDREGGVNAAFNALAIRTGSQLIVIDTGCGDKPTSPFSVGGRLRSEMEAAGLDPAEVDVVVNTHAHADHIGGNTRLMDNKIVPTFANARYLIEASEYAWWHQEENLRSLEAAGKIVSGDWWPHLHESLYALDEMGRLDCFDGRCNVAPGVDVIRTSGHSPGHAIVQVSEGGRSAVFVADLAHHPAQLGHPTWNHRLDVCDATEIRSAVFADAAQRNSLVLASHWVDDPGHLVDEDGLVKLRGARPERRFGFDPRIANPGS